MDSSRRVSKILDKSLLIKYSQGLLVPHEHLLGVYEPDDEYIIPQFEFEGYSNDEKDDVYDKDGEDYYDNYWSRPDSEAILAPTNAIQSDTGLNEYLERFKDITYKGSNANEDCLKIKSGKITFPHIQLKHNIPPPHPKMDDDELKLYIWPTPRCTSLKAMNGNYVGRLWLDVSQGISSINYASQNNDGSFEGTDVDGDWRRIIDIPIQYGSNRCNVAIMRSYMADPEYADRARSFLEMMGFEPILPDGVFLIRNKFKRVKVFDKSLFNMSYVAKVSGKLSGTTLIPFRERVSEVRSLHTELRLSYLRLFMQSKSVIKIPQSANNDIFKYYSYPILVVVGDSEPLNLMELIQGYGILVAGRSADEVDKDFTTLVRDYSSNDSECMRILSVTRTDMIQFGVESGFKEAFIRFRQMFAPKNRSMEEQDILHQELISEFRSRYLPHCEIGDVHNPTADDIEASYHTKLRFTAVMFIDLVLSVSRKRGSNEYRLGITDRKDFSFKRWETYGHMVKDYIRTVLRKPSREMVSSQNSKPMDGNSLIINMNKNTWPLNPKPTRIANQSDYRDGIVEDVPRFNVIAMTNSVRTVKIPASTGAHSAATRKVHTSQWGTQCIANTPENANIGLINSIAEAALISSDLTFGERNKFERLIESLTEVSPEDGYLLLVDGCPSKYVERNSYQILLNSRRSGAINRGIGIATQTMWKNILPKGPEFLVVRTAHGRPLVPLIIIDKSQEKFDKIMNIPDSYDKDIFEDQYVELVDSVELVQNVVVADWIHKVKIDGVFKYTHAMIKPGHILSQVTNCLSYSEHNPAARMTYATQHIMQAIGRPFMHPEDRFDHETNYLFNPELPLVKTDTLRRLTSIPLEYQPSGGIKPRDVGVGINVNIICMSFNGNNDDAIIISQRLYDSGKFDGYYTSIKKIERMKTEFNYNWRITPKGNVGIEGRDARGQGFPDYKFSQSVILPYGESYIVRVKESQLEDVKKVNNLYELIPGEFYVKFGFSDDLVATYKDKETGTITTESFPPGTKLINLPGKEIQGDIETSGDITYIMALREISQERYNEYKYAPIFKMERELKLDYDVFIKNPGVVDVYFLEPVNGVYRMGYVPIPKTQLPGMDTPVFKGYPYTIRGRRKIQRGDVAVKIVRRGISSNSDIVDPDMEKIRFEITTGRISGIRDTAEGVEIKSEMPLDPKLGNKYAILYAQKSVSQRVEKTENMPKARWYNDKLGKWEEMLFDVVFNPLAFPSRMTIGMEYEIPIAGTIRYIYDLNINGKTGQELYENDRQALDNYMLQTYGVMECSKSLDYLTDSTTMMYNNPEKMSYCQTLRGELGLPQDSLYDVYLRGDNEVMPEIARDLPDQVQWSKRIQNKILCGTVYDVALRHLVDNKRRARAYVGRKDPLTLQPVKGRRKNGGINTGTMEVDAYKAHGVGHMLYERLSLVSDREIFKKCPQCGGLLSKNSLSETLVCIDCDQTSTEEEAITHNTVNSWHLFKNYLNPLGIAVTENFT